MKHTEISGILEEEKRESEEENMEKKKIGIIFGGCSPEYGVSLESSYSVITHINQEKYEIVLIGITKEGDGTVMKEMSKQLKKKNGEKQAYVHQLPFQVVEATMVF